MSASLQRSGGDERTGGEVFEERAAGSSGPRASVAARSVPDPGLVAELAEASARLETAGPLEVLGYAADRFGDGLVLAASFQDCVLVDLATRVAPAVTVVFVDTGSHFPETFDYLHEVERRYSLRVEVLSAGLPAGEWPCGSARCCELRKVAPLNAFLATRAAWATGLKRVDTPNRADAPIVGWDASKGLVKVNPIARWTEDDVEAYIEEHRLPRHPLNAFGYLSIGCAPTTRPVAPGEDPRSGRWAGTAKTECGLHL
jgi:phosphoadenosine phosphosulfate reductase